MLQQAFGVCMIGIVWWQILLQPKSFYGQVRFKNRLLFDLINFSYELDSSQRPGAVLRGGSVAKLDFDECHDSAIRQCEESEETCWDCMQLGDVARLSVQRSKDERCHTIKWTALSKEFTPVDCVSLRNAHWYGGAEMLNQKWPSSEQTAEMKPFLAADVLQNRSIQYYGSVLGRMWISSEGFAIYVPNHVPLHVSLNEEGNQQLCMKADYLDDHGVYPLLGSRSQLPELEYDLCESRDAKEAYRYMITKYFDYPKGVPDTRMMKSPIWSTWAQYKMHVNQSLVMQYARDILKHNFTNSQLEIDDKWSVFYGDMVFDPIKFPSPKQMVDQLKDMGFRVTIWVTPFFNTDSSAFQEAVEKEYLVKDQLGAVPALVKWWQGIGGLLDVTNPAAVEWYQSNLRNLLQETGIDSFKFDGGEVYSYMPRHFRTHVTLQNPGDFTARYAELVADLGGMVEMRSGYNSQGHPIFIRMMDKDSVWGYDNGLKTMIPTALVMSVLGYPFNLPDMIGGNGIPTESAGDMLESSVLPDRELFIRWVQLSAYLPSMQFSIAPWQYDEEVVEISREMVTLHEIVVTPLVIDAAVEAVTDGTPIIRPLWWHDPEDKVALTSDSEFLVGSDLLVAPILDKGATSRDIYLPKGSWRNNLKGGTYQGPVHLKNYEVALSEIPTFTRES